MLFEHLSSRGIVKLDLLSFFSYVLLAFIYKYLLSFTSILRSLNSPMVLALLYLHGLKTKRFH